MRACETVLFSDLDGTLFDSVKRISSENREAIARYEAEGGLFAISTGRLPQNAATFLGDLPVNGPSVVVNGAAIYDFSTGTFSHTTFLDRAAADPVFKHCIEAFEGLDLQLVTPEGIVYLTPEATAHPTLLATHRPCRFLGWNDVENLPFFKALIYAPEERVHALGRELSALSSGRYAVMEFVADGADPYIYYEVMPIGINKGKTLRSLRNDPRVKGRTFFAIGDYRNDLELIKEADVGIAPANALDEVKAIADRVTVSNDESAVAHVIRDIIPEA